MISVSAFVHHYGSFWKAYFPAMENYVRIVNSGAYSRHYSDLNLGIDPGRSYIISEASFCLYKSNGTSKAAIKSAFLEARKRLSHLPGVPDDINPLSEKEITAVQMTAERLKNMVVHLSEGGEILFDPLFAGYGALAKSYGDIIAGDILIEVKAVDRPFRVSDYRQLLLYVFLNLAQGNSKIKRICVLNPRRGILHLENFDQFVFDSSGASIAEAQSALFAAIGMGGVSR